MDLPTNVYKGFGNASLMRSLLSFFAVLLGFVIDQDDNLRFAAQPQ